MSDSALCTALPIYDAQLNVVTHELLLSHNTLKDTDFGDADPEVCDLMLNAFSGVSYGANTKREHPVLVPVTRNLLCSSYLPSKFREQVVFNYSARSGLDRDVTNAIKSLSKDGYQFAICDLEEVESGVELLGSIRYLKLDSRRLTLSQMKEVITILNPLQVTPISEHIEHFSVFNGCIELGFEQFQGPFLTEPQPIKGKKLEASTQIVFKLAQELQNPDTNADRIEQVLCQDATLSYKLFRILNSAAMAMPRKITTIKQAVVILGVDRVGELTVLIALSNLHCKSTALFHLQMVRAGMCERLAIAKNYEKPKQYFLAGMFSCLDAMLDLDMDYLLDKVPLDETIVNAILHHEGTLGQVLNAVIGYELADWSRLKDMPEEKEQLKEAYVDSLRWANSILPAFLLGK